MTVDLLKPRSLTDAINMIVAPVQFILELVFKNRKQHFTENVDIPITKHARKLARFSRNTSPGAVVVKGDAEIKSLKIPHIREKMYSSAATALTLSNQGGIYANQSQKKAHELEIADNLLILKERQLRVMELMACKAITTGVVDFVGTDIDYSIDFGFHSSHKPTLSGTARWGQSAADVTGNLRTWKGIVQKDFGAMPDICVLGASAAAEFIKDEGVMKALNNLNYRAGVLDLAGSTNYIGRYLNMDFYEYAQGYVDENGDEQQMFPAAACVMIASGNHFVRNFGPVVDLDGGLLPVEFFSKSFPEQDPSGIWVLAETNPLTSVNNPNAILAATVV